ncbi:MAG: GNAT family N-acetyltransferase [Armatimonas sp.]
MSVILEIASTTDAGLIHRLTQAAFAEYGQEPGTSTALKETPADISALLAEGNQALVVTIAGDPVACVRYRIEGDFLYFFRLSVDPAHRRKGLATLLICHLEVLAREAGLSRLTCSVRMAKTDNVALYTRHGFQIMGTRIVYRDGIEVPTGDLEKPLPCGKRSEEEL